jgi:hypothetical protein
MSIPKQGNSCLRFPGRYGLQRDKVFHAKLDIVDTLMDISTNASNDGPTPNDADPRQFSCGLIGIAIGGFLFFRYTTPNWRSFKKLSAIVVSGGAHSLKSATGGYAMGIYGLPIDLEALKTNARPLPGITDAQRNWSAVREQMHGYDRTAAPPDERDRRTDN